jgi:subtilisin family serine protease
MALSSSGLSQENPAGKGIKRLAAQAIESNPNLEYNPYTLLVKFRTMASEETRAAIRAQVGGIWLDKVTSVPGLEVISTQIEPSVAAKSLVGLPWVEYAEVDYVVRASVIPNDPGFSQLWGMHNTGQSGGTVDADIDAPEAWDKFTGSNGVRIAVIDTGVQYDHPDLAANVWTNPGEIPANGVDDEGNGYVDDVHGYDFINNDGDPRDDNNHGTHCSGTIGGVGNNAQGVAGVNWHVSIVGLKFLGAGGSGSTSGAIGAVNYCIANGIKISSNSWGGGGFSQALFDAINAAGNMGHIFVAAAGNNNSNNDTTAFYPASYSNDNIISVAAIDRLDAKSSFSNYGATTVDLGAPGSSIYSTVTGSSYATFSGTSMACPHVSGAVALLWGYKPTWTRQQVKSNILATVRPTSAMSGRTLTGGVLNVNNSLNAATNAPPAVTITAPANGTSVVEGTSITFTGTAQDTEDGNISANLSWSSNLDGKFGDGSTVSTSTLAVGVHTVTASVTDANGANGSASISVTVTATPTNTPPTVAITSPANNSSTTQGTAVTFTGTADDTQDGDLSTGLIWSSSLDGFFDIGSSVTTSTLRAGIHTITASVSDSGGLSGSASITFTVTVTGPVPPSAPSNLVATKLRPGVRLNWTDNSNDEDGFQIERQQRSGKSWGAPVTFTVGSNVNSFTENPGTGQFRYRVQAFNSAGGSAWTNYVTVKL